MIIDRRLQVSSNQALTATAVSADTIDFGSDRDVGTGYGMWVCVAFKTAMAGTSPTFRFEVQTDDNVAFSSPATLVTSETVSGATPAGRFIVVPFPMTNERHVRLNYVLGGTSPTVTVDAWITNQHPTSWQGYPDAI